MTTAAAQTDLQFRVVADSLHVPWELIPAPDGRLWFTERNGRVSALNLQTGETKLLARIEGVVEMGESGLLGMALHPAFPDSPFVYLTHTYLRDQSLTEKIVRYTYTPDTLTEPFILLDGIRAANIHDGSRLAFGPDGKLYVSTGDASDRSLAQDTLTLNGKILRLNPDGTIPDDNPFAGNPVWSYGHRNAQGLVFAPDGVFYNSEHGQNNDDEINLIEKGRNYGWPTVEGYCNTPAEKSFCLANNVREPLNTWTPTIAPAGLAYYGDTLIPEWKGSLLLLTLNAVGRDLRVLRVDSSAVDERIYFDNEFGRLRGICVWPDGRVFISTSNRDGRGAPIAADDRILEIAPKGFTQRDGPLRMYAPLSARPNPASADVVYLNRAVLHCLYDLTGRPVSDWRTAAQVEVSGLAAGVYILRAATGEALRICVAR